jgi:hypothetical protein
MKKNLWVPLVSILRPGITETSTGPAPKEFLR